VGHPRRHEIQRHWGSVSAAVDPEVLVQAADGDDGAVVEVGDEALDGVEGGVGGGVRAGEEAGRERGVRVRSVVARPGWRVTGVRCQCPTRGGDGRPTRGSAGASIRCGRT